MIKEGKGIEEIKVKCEYYLGVSDIIVEKINKDEEKL